MAVLGAASCGGGGEEGGAGSIAFTYRSRRRRGLRTLIDRFNQQSKGGIQVTWRQTPAASDEYFEQMRSELQSGK
jgi:ABC-type glycerol-3-phosphate transport system substrate-binding protein